MPRIPDVTALGARPIPTSGRAITRDRSGEMLADGISQIVDEQVEKRDRFDAGRARAALLQADIDARRELENDQDYGTHETRYLEKMKKARDTAAGMFRTRSDRAAFEMDSDLDIERGRGAVRDGARRIEVDTGRAAMNSTLDQNRRSALEAKDESTRTAFIQATHDTIAGARERGYISEQEAVESRQKWTSDYAEAYVGMQPVEQRVAMLRAVKPGSIPDYIDPERRAGLLKAAESENREVRVRAKAQEYEDQIFAAGGSLESMRRKARLLSQSDDPDAPLIRDSVLSRIEARVADVDADRERYQRRANEEAWAYVLSATTTDAPGPGGRRGRYQKPEERAVRWDDIPAGVVARMDPKAAHDLRKFVEAGGNVKTDPVRWSEIMQQAEADPKAFMSRELLRDRHKIDQVDFERFVGMQQKMRDGLTVTELSGQDTALVKRAAGAMGIKTGAKASEKAIEQFSRLHLRYAQELESLQMEQGKPATQEQRQRVLDKLTMDVVVDEGAGWFNLSDSAKGFELPTFDEIPAADKQAIEAALRSRGVTPTEDEILALYTRGLY